MAQVEQGMIDPLEPKLSRLLDVKRKQREAEEAKIKFAIAMLDEQRERQATAQSARQAGEPFDPAAAFPEAPVNAGRAQQLGNFAGAAQANAATPEGAAAAVGTEPGVAQGAPGSPGGGAGSIAAALMGAVSPTTTSVQTTAQPAQTDFGTVFVQTPTKRIEENNLTPGAAISAILQDRQLSEAERRGKIADALNAARTAAAVDRQKLVRELYSGQLQQSAGEYNPYGSFGGAGGGGGGGIGGGLGLGLPGGGGGGGLRPMTGNSAFDAIGEVAQRLREGKIKPEEAAGQILGSNFVLWKSSGSFVTVHEGGTKFGLPWGIEEDKPFVLLHSKRDVLDDLAVVEGRLAGDPDLAEKRLLRTGLYELQEVKGQEKPQLFPVLRGPNGASAKGISVLAEGERRLYALSKEHRAIVPEPEEKLPTGVVEPVEERAAKTSRERGVAAREALTTAAGGIAERAREGFTASEERAAESRELFAGFFGLPSPSPEVRAVDTKVAEAEQSKIAQAGRDLSAVLSNFVSGIGDWLKADQTIRSRAVRELPEGGISEFGQERGTDLMEQEALRKRLDDALNRRLPPARSAAAGPQALGQLGEMLMQALSGKSAQAAQ